MHLSRILGRLALLALGLGGCEVSEVPMPEAPPIPGELVTAPPPPPPTPTPTIAASRADPAPAGLGLTADEMTVLDRRAAYLHPRASGLLAIETQQLGALLNATPEASRERPLLLRRLAEDNVELAHAAESEAHTDATLAVHARRAAIADYRALIDGAPTRLYPDVDEVAWYLALECERAGDAPCVRSVALRLVTDHPYSRVAPQCHYLLGAEFVAEAATDGSKHALAAEAFAKAARTSDADLSRLARRRLEHEARLAGDVAIADEAARRLAVSSPPPAVAGCTMDVQCKGDRVCRAGRCTDP